MTVEHPPWRDLIAPAALGAAVATAGGLLLAVLVMKAGSEPRAPTVRAAPEPPHPAASVVRPGSTSAQGARPSPASVIAGSAAGPVWSSGSDEGGEPLPAVIGARVGRSASSWPPKETQPGSATPVASDAVRFKGRVRVPPPATLAPAGESGGTAFAGKGDLEPESEPADPPPADAPAAAGPAGTVDLLDRALGLSPEQRRALEAAIESHQFALRAFALRLPAMDDARAGLADAERMRDDLVRRMEGVLRPEQRERFRAWLRR